MSTVTKDMKIVGLSTKEGSGIYNEAKLLNELITRNTDDNGFINIEPSDVGIVANQIELILQHLISNAVNEYRELTNKEPNDVKFIFVLESLPVVKSLSFTPRDEELQDPSLNYSTAAKELRIGLFHSFILNDTLTIEMMKDK